MQKPISMIKNIGFLTLLIASIGTSQAKALKDFDGHDLAQRCAMQVDALTKVKDLSVEQSFSQSMKKFESHMIKANNVLFESFLFADVSPNLKIRQSAQLCRVSMREHLDDFIASDLVGDFLAITKRQVSTEREQRVQDKYQHWHQRLANDDFLKLKAQAKQASTHFRKGTQKKHHTHFDLPLSCFDNLDEKYQKKYVKSGTVVAPLTSGNYATFVKRLPLEECRKKAYAQYQGRHRETNKQNLLNLIALQNEKAQSLGYRDFTEYSFRNTTLKTANQVDTLLSSIVKGLPKSLAPWDYRYIEYQTAKEKQTSEYLTPDETMNGLFGFLEKTLLFTVKPIAQKNWNAKVKGFQLLKNDQLIGEFYLDLYSRKDKYPKNRHRTIKRGVLGVQLPSSALILNLPNKKWQQRHIKSFFHEFGHLLHNLLAQQPYHIVSGISLETDIIEMPAKVFEWLSFDPAMQQKMFNKVVVQADTPEAGTTYKLRLYRAALALAYFKQPVTDKNIEQINGQLSRQYLGYPYPKNASNQYSFSHLGTYGPKYYSYILSELIARKFLVELMQGNFSSTEFLNVVFKQGGSISFEQMLSALYGKSVSETDIILWITNEKDI